MSLRDVMTLASGVGRLFESAASRPCVREPEEWDEMTAFEQELWLDSVAEDSTFCPLGHVFKDDPAAVAYRY
jgi:hypothetical protein